MAFFTDYADHMWRFYTAHRDAQLMDCSAPERADWTACYNVFRRIRPEWRCIVLIWYGTPDRAKRREQLDQYCKEHAMPEGTVIEIINNARRAVAEERGLSTARKQGVVERGTECNQQ